jgi:hypothetical protein
MTDETAQALTAAIEKMAEVLPEFTQALHRLCDQAEAERCEREQTA